MYTFENERLLAHLIAQKSKTSSPPVVNFSTISLFFIPEGMSLKYVKEYSLEYFSENICLK